MRLLGNKLTVRWLLAAVLLLFGLMCSGLSNPANNPDHLPARAQARAASAQQALQRRVESAEQQRADEAKALPLLAVLLLAGLAARTGVRVVRAKAEVPRAVDALWLTPTLFRPPPVSLS